MKKKKSWRDECKEHGSLIVGYGEITYELDGKQKRIQDKDDVLEKQLLSAPAPGDE